MSQCPARGAITVGGREVTSLRCELEEWHAWPGSPPATKHRFTFEWADDGAEQDLPEASLYDPDERFDLDVPFPEEPKPCPMCGRRHFAVPGTAGVCDR